MLSEVYASDELADYDEVDPFVNYAFFERGSGSKLGIGDEVENETDPHIYNHGLVTVGEKSIIPPGVIIGKNTCIFGATEAGDYPDGNLYSGKTLIKAGEEI